MRNEFKDREMTEYYKTHGFVPVFSEIENPGYEAFTWVKLEHAEKCFEQLGEKEVNGILFPYFTR